MEKTLYDYYQKKGQKLPSVAERMGVAQQAGIQNYSGTASQNAQLLNYLQSSQGTQNRVPVFDATKQMVQQGVITPNGVDISAVNPDVDVVPEFALTPPTNLPPLSLSFASQTSETSSAMPQAKEIDRITGEIAILEEQMAQRENQRAQGYETASVWDDMRRLNELNASLRSAQDRKIEIPLEAKQDLRGRGATLAEFDQTTAPGLEKAALQELVASRGASRLADEINLNIARVDQAVNAKIAEDKVFYDQKHKYLTSLQTAYSSILTAEKNLELEIAKGVNEAMRKTDEAKWKIIEKQAEIAIERGDFTGAQRMYESGDTDLAFQINQANSDKVAGAASDMKIDSAIMIVDKVDNLLGMEGLRWAVGPRQINRITPNIHVGKTKDFITALDGFVASETLETLVEIKARGGTFGALSDKELLFLEKTAVQINRSDRGGVAMTKDAFKDVMATIKTASQKVYLAEMGMAGSVLREMSAEQVNAFYEANRLNQREATLETNYFDSEISNTVSSTIRQFEGYSPEAYPDAGGWAIGFGSQTHPDGRPVRPGDTINPQQAEQYLASAIQKHSNWKNYTNTNLSPTQQAALASFEFNHGPAIWQKDVTAREILALVNQGNTQRAGQLMQQFVYAFDPRVGDKVVNDTLVRRRLEEARLLNTA